MDVIVVGGGVIGLFSAYYLARRGFNVSIVDAGYVKASRFNAGFIVPSFALITKFTLSDVFKAIAGRGPIRVSLPGPGLTWLWRAYRSVGLTGFAVRELGYRSLELYSELFSRERLDVDVARGVLALFLKRSDAEAFSRKVKGKLVEESELESLGYKGFEAGLLVEEEFALDPERLDDSMRGLLENYGVKFVDDRVLRVSGEERVKLSLARTGALEADSVVLACGSWTRGLTKPLGYDPGVEPARGLVVKLKLRDEIVEGPGLMEDYGVAVQQHPSTGTLRATGFFDLLGFNEIWAKSRVDWLLDKVRRHLARLGGVGFREAELSTGFRPCTPTMTPVVGFIPGNRRIVVATGHCRLGVTLAPATGELVADLIEGSKPGLSHEAIKELRPI
ncbi:MAG: NAD(P)/FAD-dependent oxidoreductase, partial [Acidilobaceae archaeon]